MGGGGRGQERQFFFQFYVLRQGTELGCIPLGTLNVALTSEKDFDPGSESNALILVVTYPEANSRRSLFFKGFEFLNGRVSLFNGLTFL